MLTTAEKRRLRLSLPQTFTPTYEAEVDGQLVSRSTTIEPNYLWVGSDAEEAEDNYDDYPVILLQWDSQGGSIANEEVLNRFVERIYDESFDVDSWDGDYIDPLFDGDDEVFIELFEQRQEGELQITPVVETKWVDGIPPQPRTEEMARQCWRWVTFRARRELNSIGDRGQRPMVVEPSGEPTPARMMDTYRAPMTAIVRHTESFREVVPVVQDEEIEANTEAQ